MTKIVEITIEFTFEDDAKPDKRALAEALQATLLMDGLPDLPESEATYLTGTFSVSTGSTGNARHSTIANGVKKLEQTTKKSSFENEEERKQG